MAGYLLDNGFLKHLALTTVLITGGGALALLIAPVAGVAVTLGATAGAGALTVLLVNLNSRTATFSPANHRSDPGVNGVSGGTDTNGVRDIINDLYQLVLQTEGSARKLGAQVAETLGSTARIASQTATGSHRAESLTTEVAEGAAAMEEIVAAIESLVARISYQRELVQQSASATEEMSASIRRVAEVSSSRHSDAEQLRPPPVREVAP